MLAIDSKIRVFPTLLSATLLATSLAAADAPTDPELEAVVDEIRANYTAAQEQLEELPQDRFDGLAVAEEADFEASAIVDWVAENTRWVPYSGTLRGAAGVLLDRRGNSLDRSLLLAELLEDAGYETRLRRGELPSSAVESMFRSIDDEDYEADPMKSLPSADGRAAVDRARKQADALGSMVELAGGRWSEGLASAAADHWWVEAKLDSDWESLDPLLRGPLAALRPESGQIVQADQLPDDLYHRVKVRVVIERWSEGDVIEETPLEHSMRPADLTYHDLELSFSPFGFEAPPEDADARAQAVALADTTQDWLPVIRFGEEMITDLGFGIDGELEKNLEKPAIGKKLESATSALQGLTEEAAPETALTACWLEFEIDVPGETPRIIRREVFDLFGPARRQKTDLAALANDADAIRERGLALAGTTRILVTGSQLPSVAFQKASLELWARQGPQLAAFARMTADPTADEPLQRFYQEPLPALDLLGLAVARGELSRHRDAIYLGSPNVLSAHYVLRIADELETQRYVDIVFNEVGVAASGTTSPAAIRLEQGVLDTVLEGAVTPDGIEVHNTAELFSLRGEKTGEWAVGGSRHSRSPLPAAARSRMAAAMAAGRIVVAPESTRGRLPAWWEIDPATGTTLGIGWKGWGTEGTEDVLGRAFAKAGAKEGTEKLGINVSCKLLFAVWRSHGYIIMVNGGTVRLPTQLIDAFLKSKCTGSWLLLTR